MSLRVVKTATTHESDTRTGSDCPSEPLEGIVADTEDFMRPLAAGGSRRARQERDLYLRLLELTTQQEPTPFLKEALRLIVGVTSARTGFLEVHGDEPDGSDSWWISHGFSDEEVREVRDRVSRGIIAEAIASGQAVETPSAMQDDRFASRASVKGQRIEAVLCVPIGLDSPCGVLYLQGRTEPDPFGEEDREKALLFARHLAPLADNLRSRHRRDRASDPTQPYRERLRLDRLVGASPALAHLFHEISLVAPLDVSVLLTGESGVGKGEAARVIHENGPRASEPFIDLNCAALPDSLVESELFGALPGSHSTATRAMPGKVEAAESGTLFLDEVGDLSPSVQSKLLQLLQSRQYFPLGATTAVQANVRVIAATNVDLEKAVAEGRFREDLYYRLHVLPVRVPSLAERSTDLGLLCAFLSSDGCSRHGLPSLEVSRSGLRAVETAGWPGNIRQLANAIEAAAIRAAGEGASSIEERHIFPDRVSASPTSNQSATFHEATRDFQRRLVEETLEDSGWNVAEAARRLDLARSHVYNLIGSYGLKRDE